MKDLTLHHSLGQSLELQPGDRENPLWRYVYGGKPKPFFHPLRTPAGFCLSLFEPHDHVWHRGLWFAIKYVNGENFWEENGDFGTQVSALPPTVSHAEDGAIAWTHEQRWERPGGAGGAGSILAEARAITYRPLGADSYALDWDIRLRAQDDVVLDRTPFGSLGSWGGYGGLTLRGNRNWQKTRLLTSDGATHDRPLGVPALWADLSGAFDGGRDQSGGIALFDHPENARHPSPWYGATGAGHYFNAAFLFHKPMPLHQGEELRLRYRALIHDGVPDAPQLQAAYDTYLEQAADG